jgi:PASTA domain
VLLISADLRRPRAHEFFGLPNTTGLGDILTGKVDPETAIRKTPIGGLWLIPSGTPPSIPIADALSKGTEALLRFCRERFDFIVLDCPPLLRVADSLELVPQGDGVLLVAEAERTRVDALVQARAALEQVNAPAVVAVLNRLRPEQGGYGYYRYEAATSPPPSETEPQIRRGVFPAVALGVLALLVGLSILILASSKEARRFSPSRFPSETTQHGKAAPRDGSIVPDVSGLTASDARGQLLEVDLALGSAIPTPGPPGAVVRTDPASGRAVPPGTAVTIYVGVESHRMKEASDAP